MSAFYASGKDELEGVLTQGRLPLPLWPDVLHLCNALTRSAPHKTLGLCAVDPFVDTNSQTLTQHFEASRTVLRNPERRTTPTADNPSMSSPDSDRSSMDDMDDEDDDTSPSASGQSRTTAGSGDADVTAAGKAGSAGTEQTTNSSEFRCWEHDCNGKVFSNRSNLLRHHIEKGRARPNFRCPMCGAFFSRTTARNQHVAKKSCTRVRRYSNGRERPRPRVID
ncbi:hypothetical protein DOTSEDRAFT_73808 [Dothistroma septosporum NZE10]|uniref:Uncharacterized protein n=1 Tax=Dothistroma septosporum (strain NZE10 / CBS 128990) TaxID=675120 RepID=N1PFW2_DOTSN|nr:hypothetical protein DOTSEDRAFT_73808 [Dothistroma septosporum NZE10]